MSLCCPQLNIMEKLVFNFLPSLNLRSTILSLDLDPLKLPPLSLFCEDLLATLAADNRRTIMGEDVADELFFGGGK